MLHREHLTPLSFCLGKDHPSVCVSVYCIMDWGVTCVFAGFPLFIATLAQTPCLVFLNQKPEACGGGLTSPLVLHDLKWAALHSTTGLGAAAIKTV